MPEEQQMVGPAAIPLAAGRVFAVYFHYGDDDDLTIQRQPVLALSLIKDADSSVGAVGTGRPELAYSVYAIARDELDSFGFVDDGHASIPMANFLGYEVDGDFTDEQWLEMAREKHLKAKTG